MEGVQIFEWTTNIWWMKQKSETIKYYAQIWIWCMGGGGRGTINKNMMYGGVKQFQVHPWDIFIIGIALKVCCLDMVTIIKSNKDRLMFIINTM